MDSIAYGSSNRDLTVDEEVPSMKYCLHFVCFALSVLLFGCSKAPTEQEAKTILSTRVTNESKTRMALEEFKKIDGQASEPNGVKTYELNYSAHLVFKTDAKWLSVLGQSSFEVVDPPSGRKNWDGLGDALKPGIERKAGARLALNGTMVFSKTEKGWRLETDKIDKISDIGAAVAPPAETQPSDASKTSNVSADFMANYAPALLERAAVHAFNPFNNQATSPYLYLGVPAQNEREMNSQRAPEFYLWIRSREALVVGGKEYRVDSSVVFPVEAGSDPIPFWKAASARVKRANFRPGEVLAAETLKVEGGQVAVSLSCAEDMTAGKPLILRARGFRFLFPGTSDLPSLVPTANSPKREEIDAALGLSAAQVGDIMDRISTISALVGRAKSIAESYDLKEQLARELILRNLQRIPGDKSMTELEQGLTNATMAQILKASPAYHSVDGEDYSSIDPSGDPSTWQVVTKHGLVVRFRK